MLCTVTNVAHKSNKLLLARSKTRVFILKTPRVIVVVNSYLYSYFTTFLYVNLCFVYIVEIYHTDSRDFHAFSARKPFRRIQLIRTKNVQSTFAGRFCAAFLRYSSFAKACACSRSVFIS